MTAPAVNPEEAERRALDNLKTHARRVLLEDGDRRWRPGGLVGAAIEWARAEAAVSPARARERILRDALQKVADRGCEHPSGGCPAGAPCRACLADEALGATFVGPSEGS